LNLQLGVSQSKGALQSVRKFALDNPQKNFSQSPKALLYLEQMFDVFLIMRWAFRSVSRQIALIFPFWKTKNRKNG
jgi:hypothetical protein